MVAILVGIAPQTGVAAGIFLLSAAPAIRNNLQRLVESCHKVVLFCNFFNMAGTARNIIKKNHGRAKGVAGIRV